MIKRYRTEWKYLCSQRTGVILYERLRNALVPDSHADPDGTYQIHSLYFDDHLDSCAADNEAGIDTRAKYRIRSYGTNARSLHFEEKKKINGRTYKSHCSLSDEDAKLLVTGKMNELFWQTQDPLLKRFCIAGMTKNYEPKLFVSYKRAALVEPSLNVRVTFDSQISVAETGSKFDPADKRSLFPLFSDNNLILEVKFDDFLPGWIRQIIESEQILITSFSKYYLGRKRLESVYR